MKILLALLLALCAVLSVHAVDERLCDGSVNCNCDLTKYNSSVTPPRPTIYCENEKMTLYISKCQLAKSLFNTSNLSLINNTGAECASKEYLVDGEIQEGFHNPMSFMKCGNNLTINSTHVIYSNILYIYAEERTIINRNNYSMNVSCVYPLNYPVALNITLKPKTVTTGLSIPGVSGEMQITMGVFTESSFTNVVTDSTTLYVEDTVYIRVWMPALEADTFAIKVIRLYATPGGTGPESGLVFNLTSGPDGCPNPEYGDGLITVLQNGNSSEARFAMKVFKITDQDYVKLYADTTICTSSCVVNCNQRLLRAQTPENVASMSVELAAEDSSFSGAANLGFSLSWIFVSLISSLLFGKFM
ncbi:pancreatic secretory granule membrane major glycoprotein GP2-like [Eleutherodactylus coqui]|uniref:pancreatic secretory granule membrane major glycoprotein GP2-like n=1 Tax=Eleutherodactylus coqui TaxID=57060 RepID=UPI0034633F79